MGESIPEPLGEYSGLIIEACDLVDAHGVVMLQIKVQPHRLGNDLGGLIFDLVFHVDPPDQGVGLRLIHLHLEQVCGANHNHGNQHDPEETADGHNDHSEACSGEEIAVSD